MSRDPARLWRERVRERTGEAMAAGDRPPWEARSLLHRLWETTGLLALICSLLVCCSFGSLAAALRADTAPGTSVSSGAPATLAGEDWTQYRFDIRGSGMNPENLISSATIGGLTPRWSLSGYKYFAATPAVVGDTVYLASMQSLYALDLRTGAVRWRFDDPFTTDRSFPFISSSVAVNTALHLAYFGDPAARVIAVDIRTGKAVWTVQLDKSDGVHAHIWSSPLLVNDKLYIGVSSTFGVPCVRGNIVALDQATGAVAWTHFTVPEGILGGSEWSSMSANPERHEVIATTSNPCTSHHTAGQEDSIIGLDWDTGQLVWQYQALSYDDCDCDFGQGAADVQYHGREYIVAGNKLGTIYGLVRDPSGGAPRLAWKVPALPGVFSPPTYGNGLVFVPAGPPLDQSCRYGAVYAIHVETGQLAWRACTPEQNLHSPSALSGDVLFVAIQNSLVAYEASSGRILRTFALSGPSDTVWGGVAVSHGYVLVDTTAGHLYAFSL
jgi:outer membrane protein assembly factor BamB